jgi:peptidyl-prolyl cis-trans isomerase SurA
MIKRLTGLALSAAICLAATVSKGQDKVIDQIIAVVGGNTILKSDIESRYIEQQAQGITSDGDMKCEILEDLLVEKLLLAEAELDTTIEVSDNQVNQSLDQRIQYFVAHLGSEKAVEEYFKKPIVQLKADMEDVIRNQNKTQQMQEKIIKNVAVTPSEVRYHFRNMSEDKLPMIDQQVEYEQITVMPPISPEEENRIKSTLRELKKRIEDGESFSALAVVYSEDGTAIRGGELDYMGRAQLDPAYAAAAFNLKGDKISNVVKSDFGYHILQVMDRRGDQIKTRHIIMIPKVSDKDKEKAKNQIDSIANYIRKGTFSFEDAAMRYSYDINSRNNGGLVINPNTMSSKWRMEELDPDVSKVIDKLKINEISAPFQTIDDKQRLVYKIIRLKNRTPAHRANLRDDYIELADQYLAEKKEEKFQNWIREKQRITYVHIDDTYLNCNFKYKGWIK